MRTVILVLFGLLASLAAAQTASIITAKKDTQSQVELQRAVDALGGASAIAATDNCLAQGNVFSSTSKSGTRFVWKNSGSAFRYELYLPAGLHVIVSNHDDPVWMRGAQQTRLFYHSLGALRPAYLVGKQLMAAATDTSTSATATAANDVATRRESDLLPALSQRQWSFDAVTGLPSRVTYPAPEAQDANSTTIVAVSLSDYRPVAGIFIPFRVITSMRGITNTAVLDSVACGMTFDPADFEARTGGAQ
jgi:hypothetical protein